MAAQTADTNKGVAGQDIRKIVSVPVAGATAMSGAHTIFNNAPVASDANVAGGYAHQVDTGTTWASGDVFFGIALGHVDVLATDTADGVFSVSVAQDGKWPWAVASLTNADLGKKVYVTDDNTASITSTNALWIGHLSYISGTTAWIDIEAAAGKAMA